MNEEVMLVARYGLTITSSFICAGLTGILPDDDLVTKGVCGPGSNYYRYRGWPPEQTVRSKGW